MLGGGLGFESAGWRVQNLLDERQPLSYKSTYIFQVLHARLGLKVSSRDSLLMFHKSERDDASHSHTCSFAE